MDKGENKPIVRFFDWRDLLLIQRLQEHGQTLDYEAASVDGVFALRDAVHSYLRLSPGIHRTLVMPGSKTFVQFICLKGSRRVHLTYLAPAPTKPSYSERWIELLEHLVATVGANGIHHIVAEARDDGPAIELLQQAGFGVFARQTLFQLSTSPPSIIDPPTPSGLRAWRSTDDWGLRLLYSNTVPQLVQQIEGPTDNAFAASQWENQMVVDAEGEVIASLTTRRGRVGSALRLLIHPQAAAQAESLILNGVMRLVGRSNHPVFCRIRRYEGWLHAPLEACGFKPVAHTALLVKHTVSRVMTPEWQRIPVAEGRAEVTTPVTQARFQKNPHA